MKSTFNFLAFFIIALTVFWSFFDMKPHYYADKDDSNPQDFSVNTALYHLKNISQKPHPVGTEEHKNVQNYLFNELKKIGLTPEIQIETVFNKKWKAGTTVENIIAKIEGTDHAQKSLLLLSHYDSNPHSAIGSSDAGSGIVTILEGIRAYIAKKQQPKNDIIIVFSDAEELGLLGAQAFVEKHPLAKNVGLVLNFEARGSGGPSYMLMETNGKNSKLLSEFIKAQPNYPVANSLTYSVYKMLPNDTDLTVLREECDINGFNFAFIDDHFDYHTSQDNYSRLDRESLVHQVDYFTTSLNYFSNSDLSNLHSDEDWVYVNFPLTKFITYPFSWILPLLLIALVALIVLVFIGIQKNKLTITGIFKGFVPFLVSVILCGSISYLLWKLLLFIHPQYQDMLHGFTYNGYYYIAAFVVLSIYITFKIYNQFKPNTSSDLLIAPIIIWIAINFLTYQYLKGASFFIIPVFVALLILSILLFTDIKKRSRPTLFAIFSVPTIYIFAPLVKMFPVGLGLKNLFISALLISLVLGLLVPIFHQQKKKNGWQSVFGFFSIIFFIIATFNSGFTTNRKKPNSLVYIQNSDDNNAYWATYNKNFDSYVEQVFKNDYKEGGIANAETKSKYNSHFTYHKKTESRNIKPSEITISKDTIIENIRHIDFTLTPTRKITKYELFNHKELTLSHLTANSAVIYDTKTTLTKETLLVYYMANTDNDLKVSLAFNKDEKPLITLNEISNDLLTHESFHLKPRSESMLPMPFVTNDAIICSKNLTF
ncbi:M20/M25/M40 family metallo-hydrolase [Tenacibaculum sp. IB213877]|uniref:M20/M25/M40 family metallo-hydrolase n=1 Tax=Tenacibaculum sp. IB213877 TaxID=3097351 RepID=UPI002A5A63E7|nr:M20/M25/M40 family metallo-hydrolase [Tenacibaculum sp. IB213877]MDY0781219.1 M20/M25/M40 family metallo-hydrolase [Tenacibaculum sp. IB213877]